MDDEETKQIEDRVHAKVKEIYDSVVAEHGPNPTHEQVLATLLQLVAVLLVEQEMQGEAAERRLDHLREMREKRGR